MMLNLSRGLHDRGYHVIFGTVTHSGPLKSRIPPGVEHWSVSCSPYQDNFPKFILGIVTLIKLPILLRRREISAVITDGPLPAFLFSILWVIGRYKIPWLARKGTGIAAWNHSQNPLRGNMGRMLHRISYSRATRIIVPVRGVKDDLVCHLPVKRSLVSVAPNPVDYHGIIAASKGGVEARCECTAPYVVVVNRLIPRKRTHLAIEALATLQETYPELDLVIVGDGPEKHALRKQVERLKLHSSVVFCGFVDNPMPILKGAIALLLPSSDEGFGFAVIEAMAVGCIPIAYRENPGPAATIKHDRTGLLLTPDGSITAIANALRSLIESPSRRQAIQCAAKTSAAEFGIDRACATYVELIEKGVGVTR